MPKSNQLIPEPAVKETHIVYISVRMGEPRELQETEWQVKKRDPKKHKKADKFLRFPELAREFYYYNVYVTKLKVGNQTIELRSDKVNKSKKYTAKRY